MELTAVTTLLLSFFWTCFFDVQDIIGKVAIYKLTETGHEQDLW